MKRFTFLLLLGAVAACAGGGGTSQRSTAQPGHGAISIQVIPNPIVANNVGGDRYEFPFEVVVRETGGHPVTVNRVSADVLALGSIRVAQESYDAAKIQSLGFQTSIPANGELRYRFSQRHSVTDDRLFGNVEAQLTVDATDDTGTPATARTTVTVTKP
ncbi:MAG TPA: hypothetical protein VGR02_19025 [Thermoanaerobaculia bacterium]|nr:hypothetical protein [Thermoanaerobaculia bacterium]